MAIIQLLAAAFMLYAYLCTGLVVAAIFMIWAAAFAGYSLMAAWLLRTAKNP